MDIQWVIIAKSCKINTDRTLDIGEISHHVNIFGKLRNTFPILLVAKAHFTPGEVGESKTITLKVIHDKKGEILSENTPYKVPDLYTWASSITYIVIKIAAVNFPYAGGYTFDIFIDGEYKNGESMEVTDLMEGHREKS